MSSQDLEPVAYVINDGSSFGRGPGPQPARLLGPSTGLPWGVEMVRLNCLASAENYDRLRADYAGRSEFGTGLCQGQAEGFRSAAEDLIRYAWWRVT